jgi:hypothetical protein
MASEDNVLYALLAFLIGGIIMLVIYKTKSTSTDKFRQKKSVEEFGPKRREMVSRIRENHTTRNPHIHPHPETVKRSAVPMMHEPMMHEPMMHEPIDFLTEIPSCPQCDGCTGAAGCSCSSCASGGCTGAAGCSCSSCKMNDVDAHVYVQMQVPYSASIRANTMENSNPLRGDIEITSDPLSQGAFVTHQSNLPIYEGASRIAFGC